jgi:hypothetical protein
MTTKEALTSTSVDNVRNNHYLQCSYRVPKEEPVPPS